MKRDQIAIQYYTLRDHTKSPAEFAETCKKVADIGYKAVQISGVSYDAVSPEEITRICGDHGLEICATHESSNLILESPEQVADILDTFGTRYTAYPYPAGIDFADPDSVGGLIAKLDAAGKVLADRGKVLAYHNHHVEFIKLDGRLVLDWIYAETDPAHLVGEPDTYWVQYGGGDPVAWCRKLSGRMPLIHLKDYHVNTNKEVEFCEVGNGNLNFLEIIQAADAAECLWYIVEQDRCPGDPFDSIKQSYDHLVGLAEE